MDTDKVKRKPLKLNMGVLRRSRKPIAPGDIFVLQVMAGQYHFGRVIHTKARAFGDNNMLIYIFRSTSPDKFQFPELKRDDLLVPPLIVHRLMWTRGYFETVEHRPLTKDDVLSVHCFQDTGITDPRKMYVDEYGRPLSRRSEPCGIYALSLEGAVDNEISDALGIPLSEAYYEQEEAKRIRQERARARGRKKA